MSDTSEQKKGGWFQRLKAGLTRSSSKLGDGITGIFTKRRLDDQALEELEELLITADLGVTTAAKLTANLAKTRLGADARVHPTDVDRFLSAGDGGPWDLAILVVFGFLSVRAGGSGRYTAGSGRTPSRMGRHGWHTVTAHSAATST